MQLDVHLARYPPQGGRYFAAVSCAADGMPVPGSDLARRERRLLRDAEAAIMPRLCMLVEVTGDSNNPARSTYRYRVGTSTAPRPDSAVVENAFVQGTHSHYTCRLPRFVLHSKLTN